MYVPPIYVELGHLTNADGAVARPLEVVRGKKLQLFQPIGQTKTHGYLT